MSQYRFAVNDVPVEVNAPGMRRLLDVLREDLGLTGTKEGCGEGECGACTVLLDGAPVDSCLVPVCQVDGASVATVEGLAQPGSSADAPPVLDDLQAAFLAAGGAQCGICTPGMLMAARLVSRPGRRTRRGWHSRGDRRQPVPLHRVHEDHRSDRACCRRLRGSGGRGPPGRERWSPRTDGGNTALTMPVEPPITTPRDLAEAYAAMADAPRPLPIAGGTDVMVGLTAEIGEPPDRMVDLWRLDALRGIAIEGDHIVIGALTTYTDIRRSALCREHLPVLVEAAATIGAAQIQNRATIGGNVVNASPAGDTLPVLLATDASFVVGSVARRARRPRVGLLAGLPTDCPRSR